jgi:hypothetical protein
MYFKSWRMNLRLIAGVIGAMGIITSFMQFPGHA